MKLYLVSAAPLIVGAAAFESGFDFEDALKGFHAPAVPRSLAHQVLSARQLGITEECAVDTAALYDTTQIKIANAAWEAEFESSSQATYDCAISPGTTSGTCVFDSKKLSAHNLFLSTCTEVGGTSQTFTDSFSCVVTEQGVNAQLNIQLVDIPECIVPSCDGDVGAAIVDELVSMTADSTESELSTQFNQVQCTAQLSSSAYGPHPWKAYIAVVCATLGWIELLIL